MDPGKIRSVGEGAFSKTWSAGPRLLGLRVRIPPGA